jgi:predicted component of viral defense system (DUF524 family)
MHWTDVSENPDTIDSGCFFSSLEALRVEKNGIGLTLCRARTKLKRPFDEGLEKLDFSLEDFKAVWGRRQKETDYDSPPLIELLDPENAMSRGRVSVALLEGESYKYRIELSGVPDPCLDISSSLGVGGTHAEWDSPEMEQEGKVWRGQFCLRNYLGSAWIKAGDLSLGFDIVPTKIDYDTDYRTMTQEVDKMLRNALMEIYGPTTHRFKTTHEEYATLLQQFQYIKSGIGINKLRNWVASIQRNPHRILQRETQWKASVSARPDRFLRDPLEAGRDWIKSRGNFGVRVGRDSMAPQNILEERKFDSFDTPPNRFVKFALRSFSSTCRKVLEKMQEKRGAIGVPGSGEKEATLLLTEIEVLAGLTFFSEIGELRQMPFNNPTLQRRHGYRDLLQAWVKYNWASKITWEGLADFSGNNRNVASLYEMWTYLKLAEILKTEMDLEETSQGSLADDNDGLKVNLKRGDVSRRIFLKRGGGRKVRVHLYYNRTYSSQNTGPESMDSWKTEGSYSAEFRPDITLSIISGDIMPDETPDEIEARAEREGSIRHLHFDAKYRLKRLKTTLSEDEKSEAEASSIYRRGDLMTMHCYNEAIRRSYGSYVLYPGDSRNVSYDSAQGGNRSVFFRYVEVMPGVGAFALRPGDEGGAPAVECFLRDIFRQIDQQQSKSPEQAIRETFAKPVSGLDAVVGYVRPYMNDICRAKRLFYAHAVRKEREVALDSRILPGMVLLIHNGGPNILWKSKILWITTVTEKQLATLLGNDDFSGSPDVTRYHLFYLDEISKVVLLPNSLVVNASRPRVCSLEVISHNKVSYRPAASAKRRIQEK